MLLLFLPFAFGSTCDVGVDRKIERTESSACPSSKYVSGGSCLSCPPGFECDGASAVCASSKYVSGGSCLSCPPGYECDGASAVCASSKYVSGGSCLSCPPGYECDGSTGTECSAGSYSGGVLSAVGLEFGSSGDVDYVFDSLSDPDINLCVNQPYEFGRSSAGHALRVVKGSECVGCDGGAYSSLPVSSVPGWSDVSVGSPVTVTFSEVGTYYYVCVLHSAMVGKIVVSSCDGECLSCPSGRYQGESGQSGCLSCPSGFGSLPGSASCVEDGVAYDPSYASSVVLCNTAGMYQSVDGSECFACSSGKYLDQAGLRGSFLCKDCPVGRFTPFDPVGRSVCAECSSSEYQGESGQSGCLSCPSGYDGAGASCVCGSGSFLEGSYGLVNGPYPASSLCPASGMSEVLSADMCQTAVSKLYSGGVVHVGSWYDDPKGCWRYKAGVHDTVYFNMHTSPVGGGKCDWSGYTVNGDYTSYSLGCLCWSPGAACEPCAVGRYQDQSDQDTCVSCGKGAHQDEVGQSSCSACPVGRYTIDPHGSISVDSHQYGALHDLCHECVSGRFQGQTGRTLCESCPGGWFSGPGASSCSYCVQGRYSTGGSSSCTDCPAGQYGAGGGAWRKDQAASSAYAFECRYCPSGQYGPSGGQTACVQCPPGQYQNWEGGAGCKACETSKYENQQGSTECKSCATGWYSSVGSDSADGCYCDITTPSYGSWNTCGYHRPAKCYEGAKTYAAQNGVSISDRVEVGYWSGGTAGDVNGCWISTGSSNSYGYRVFLNTYPYPTNACGDYGGGHSVCICPGVYGNSQCAASTWANTPWCGGQWTTSYSCCAAYPGDSCGSGYYYRGVWTSSGGPTGHVCMGENINANYCTGASATIVSRL